MRPSMSSMEFLPNEIEMKLLQSNPLTRMNEDGSHYELLPQRGCFSRCAKCINLSEAESVADARGAWHFTTECLFCVQRIIDLLGWYEHKKVPTLTISETQKTRKRELGGIYDAILASCQKDEKPKEKSIYAEAMEQDVFSDCVE